MSHKLTKQHLKGFSSRDEYYDILLMFVAVFTSLIRAAYVFGFIMQFERSWKNLQSEKCKMYLKSKMKERKKFLCIPVFKSSLLLCAFFYFVCVCVYNFYSNFTLFSSIS